MQKPQALIRSGFQMAARSPLGFLHGSLPSVYEVVWHFGKIKELDIVAKYQLADSIVRSLYQKGFIEFAEENWIEGECIHKSFVPDHLDSLLSNPCTWYPDTGTGIRICICATQVLLGE